MNILVKTYSGRVTVRPDTTWERDNEDVFLPEFVSEVSWTPVLFARICKPGRSVSSRFASRYYDGLGCGVLLYPENLVDGSEEGFACASCLDHTSFLPFPVSDMGGTDGGLTFSLRRDGAEIFSRELSGMHAAVASAIEEATRFCYIRTGDLLAIELAPRTTLLHRDGDGAECRVEGGCAGMSTIDFKVIL